MKKENSKNGAVIRRCDCSNEQQDRMYGKQMRVANLCRDGKESRCTVCGKIS